jgi:hypothetical protein
MLKEAVKRGGQLPGVMTCVVAVILTELFRLQAKLALQAAPDEECVIRGLSAVTGPALFNTTSSQGPEVTLLVSTTLKHALQQELHVYLTVASS